MPTDATPVLSLEPAGRLLAASDTKTRWFSGGPVVGGGMGRPPFAALVIAAHIFMSSFTLPGIFNITSSSSANFSYFSVSFYEFFPFVDVTIGVLSNILKAHFFSILLMLHANKAKTKPMQSK